MEERDPGRGGFLEALVHEGLRNSVEVSFEQAGQKEDGAGALAMERLLAQRCGGREAALPRRFKSHFFRGLQIVTSTPPAEAPA
jgi:hypothetical protein